MSPPTELSTDVTHTLLDQLWAQWCEAHPNDNESWFIDWLEDIGWRAYKPEQSHVFEGSI